MVPNLETVITLHRLLPCGLLATLLTATLPAMGLAETETSTTRIHQFQSRHFDVHTDLNEEQVASRLAAMEAVLSKSESYWGRQLKGQITCYLVHDLDHWKSQDFPTSNAQLVLQQIGGGTFIDQSRVNRRIDRSSIIYATTRPGVVEHEVVHAYCFMAFGKHGPDWYREGMAELIAQNATCEQGARCRPETLAKLRTAPLSLRKIVSRDRFTEGIAESVVRTNKPDVEFDVSSGVWNSDDDRVLAKAKIAYAESWALCYLLHHNPNYHKRFRVLGQKLVEGCDVRFEDMFSPVLKQIDFELQMLGKSIADGYRADLCRWPWAKKFQPIQVGRTIRVPLKARAGFQATRIQVAQGQEYSLRAYGSWSVEDPYQAVDADGNREGAGRIEAIIQDGFELSDPFQLSAKSRFSIPKNGRLFLRCYDDWSQLADNRGTLEVRLRRRQ